MSSMQSRLIAKPWKSLALLGASALALSAPLASEEMTAADQARVMMVAQQPRQMGQAIDRWQYLIGNDRLGFADYAGFVLAYPDFPQESRLFANEILRGAPNLGDVLAGELKALVDEKAEIIRGWSKAGRIANVDPRHLIFAIWSTTQHYADFDVQVRTLLGNDGEGRFHDASHFLKQLFLTGLMPR